MKSSELLKKIREDNKLSQKQLADMLGVSKSLVAQTEIETKGLSKNTIDKLKELFPDYSDDIDNAVIEDKAIKVADMAKTIPFKHLRNALAHGADINLEAYLAELNEVGSYISSDNYSIKVYNLEVSTNGGINLNSKSDNEEIVLPAKMRKYKNLFGVRIQGDGTRVENQELLVMNPDSKLGWEKLNDKIVFVEINKKKYIKHVKYDNYKPYLYSFNNIHPPVEVTEDVKLLGVMAYSIREISFE